jgi:hypothetical protein
MIKGERETEPRGFCHILFDLPFVSIHGDTGTDTFLQVNSRQEIPPGAINIRPVREGQTLFVTEGGLRAFHSHVHQWGGQQDFYKAESGDIKYSFLGYGKATRGEILLHKIKTLVRGK